MNKLNLSKYGCAVMLALVMPLGAVQASDDATEGILLYFGEGMATQSREPEPSSPVPQGAQGPVRTDFMADQATLGDPYPFAEDAPAFRYPFAEDAPLRSGKYSPGWDGGP